MIPNSEDQSLQMRGPEPDGSSSTSSRRARYTAYHPKRPHKKSRKGCQNCKSRKVKCDEGRPSCRVCVLRNADCVYAPAASPSNTSRPRSSASPIAAATFTTTQDAIALSSIEHASRFIVIREPLAIVPCLKDTTDMRILWHYCARTCKSFSLRLEPYNGRDDIMRITVVKQAFENPFLLNTIMALSCLHARETGNPIDGDSGRLESYSSQAVEGYRKAIDVGDPKTFGALLSNSLILTALSSQNFRSSHGGELFILEWMGIWRGIGIMIKRVQKGNVTTFGLDQLFYRPLLDINNAAQFIPSRLTEMISSIPSHDPDYPHVGTYLKGLQYLGALYKALHDMGLNPVISLKIVTWFTYLPPAFITLLRERRPRAMVILAHYAIFLKLIHKGWWIFGVGDRSLHDICKFLGPAWSHELEHPHRAMHRFNDADETEVMKLLLGDYYAQLLAPSPAARQRMEDEVENTRLINMQKEIVQQRELDKMHTAIDPNQTNYAPELSL